MMSVFVWLISLNIITLYIHYCFSNGKIQFLWLYVSQSIQLLNCVPLFVTPWTAACQASLSITNSQSLLKLMPIKLVMTSNHLILYRPLLLLPSIFPSLSVIFNDQLFASSSQSITPQPRLSQSTSFIYELHFKFYFKNFQMQ